MERILYVLHSGITGGTFLTNKDLMKYVEEKFEIYLLAAENDYFRLFTYSEGNLNLIREYPRNINLNVVVDGVNKVNNKWSAKNFHNSWLTYIYFDILMNYNIDIVHIRHLINHSFDLPQIAKKLGIPIILSIHDFYFLCPFYTLLDENKNFCAGKCFNNNKNCYAPLSSLSDINSKEFINLWRKKVLEMFSYVDFFVTTSQIVKDLFFSVYKDRIIINDGNFKIIEHGRDFSKNKNVLYDIPSKKKPIKILCPANHLNIMKGSELIKKIKNEDKENLLEFHFLGNCHDGIEEYGIAHGTFQREDFCKKVEEIKPSFIGIFSIWPETFCHTITEAWSCGIPVIGTNIGVIQDRILRNDGGWIINRNNPHESFNKIIEIASNSEEYERVIENISNMVFYSAKEMAVEYLKLYADAFYISDSKKIISSKDFKKNYEIIHDSGYFDRDFYLNKYGDVKKSGMDPLLHWVKYGFKESFRNPNSNFSNNFYNNFYLGNYTSWNSLTHYILFGRDNGFKQNLFDINKSNYEIDFIENLKKEFDNINIIIIAPKFSIKLKNCIENIFKKTLNNFQLIILLKEDSIEENCKNFFNSNKKKFKVHINNNISFADFIKKNLIFYNNHNDFVLLNFTAEVSVNWLKKLVLKAYSDEKISFVTPISNIFIDLNDFSNNNLNLSLDGLNFLINKSVSNFNLEVPFILSSCVYMKKNSFQGCLKKDNFFFDDSTGIFIIELNDSVNVLDELNYIHFNDVNLILRIFNNSYLKNMFHNFLLKDDLNKLKFLIESLVINANYKNLSNRILFITDELNYRNFLYKHIQKSYDCFYLIFSHDFISIVNNDMQIFKENYDCFKNFSRNKIIEFYFNILFSLKVDFVSIDNFSNFSEEFIGLSKILNIFTFVNINKYNFSEDNFNIIPEISTANEVIVNDYESFKRFYPLFNQSNFKLIPSQNFLELKRNLVMKKSKPIIFLVIINKDFYEEFECFFKELKTLDKNDEIEFHFLGDSSYEFEGIGYDEGSFNEKKLEKIIANICPSFIGIFSLYNETFYVIDEIKNFKIPIIFPNIKQFNFRLLHIEGAIQISSKSPKNALSTIINIFEVHYDEVLFKIYLYYENLEKDFLEILNSYIGLYVKYEDYNKLSLDDSSNLILRENRISFSSIDDFLIHSYSSPIISLSTINDFIFNQMENIISLLINNVSKLNYKPLVTVIMPVFNREDVIMDAINSVLNQTYSNFELIIVDDGSTDSTKDLLEKIKDSRVKKIYHNSNKGCASARNTAIKVSKGKFITYLDSDNLWDERYIECVVGTFLELNDSDALYFGQIICTSSNKDSLVRFGSLNKSLLFNSNFIDMNCFAHKKEILEKVEGFNINLNRLIDWEFILKIQNHFKIYSIPILISKYNLNATNRITYNSRNNVAVRNSNFYYIKHILLNNFIDSDLNKSSEIYLEKVSSKCCVFLVNFKSILNLRKCINSLLNNNHKDIIEIFVFDNSYDKFINTYLIELMQKNLINFISNETFSFKKIFNIWKKNYSNYDMVILNDIRGISQESILNMSIANNLLEDSGIIVPRYLVLGDKIRNNINYANENFYCDIAPQFYSNNILNIPIFFDGDVLKLKRTPNKCFFISHNILYNMPFNKFKDKDFLDDLSFYVRNKLNLNIYFIYGAKIYMD